MKIWYDACTGKHIRYGTAIASQLRKSGHEVVFTTREHPDTLPLAKVLGEKPIVVGKYNPSTLFSRIEGSAERIIQFSKMFQKSPPEVAIAHQSVELCRTAFGLGIPIILTADTPHATAVNRLTIPFAHTVVASEALPKSFLKKYCPNKVITFKGVDEVAWIKYFKPKILLVEKPLIVIRQMEAKAAYAQGQRDPAEALLEELKSIANVELIKRYNEQNAFGSKPEFIDSASLVANADLVISSGGTISREAALQGVPSIAVSEMAKTPVNKYLAQKGFPLLLTSPEKIVGLAKRFLGKRFDVKSQLEQLENPVLAIEKIVESLKN